MARRRQRLSEPQIAALFEPPKEQRDLVRHWTLSDADLGVIRRCRGDHNRLGYALMLCYLRFPGRALRVGERPPALLLGFVADQIEALPDCIDEYLAPVGKMRTRSWAPWVQWVRLGIFSNPDWSRANQRSPAHSTVDRPCEHAEHHPEQQAA